MTEPAVRPQLIIELSQSFDDPIRRRNQLVHSDYRQAGFEIGEQVLRQLDNVSNCHIQLLRLYWQDATITNRNNGRLGWELTFANGLSATGMLLNIRVGGTFDERHAPNRVAASRILKQLHDRLAEQQAAADQRFCGTLNELTAVLVSA